MTRLFQLSIFILTCCEVLSSPDVRWLVTKNAFRNTAPVPFGSRIRTRSPISNSLPVSSSKSSDQPDRTALNNVKQMTAILINSRQIAPDGKSTTNNKTIKRLMKETVKKHRLTNTTYTLSRNGGEWNLPSPGGRNNKIDHQDSGTNFRKSKLESRWEEKIATRKNNVPNSNTKLEKAKGTKIWSNYTSNDLPHTHLTPYAYRSKEVMEGTCSCFWNSESCGCECRGSLTYDDFQELARSFQKCLNFSFSLNRGDYFSLPPGVFTRVGKVQNFHLKITNSTFDYLFDPTPNTSPFSGVRFEEKAVIEISGVKVRRGWNWTPLQSLDSSSGGSVEIAMDDCGLRRISSDFAKVASGAVRVLAISNSQLEMIGSGAFASFDGLTSFRLPMNRLESIRRTDFPAEPLDLAEIDLRDNQLHSLDGDLFTEMPSLRSISLAGNPIRMLSEGTFSTVIGKIYFQGLSDVPLYCDCHLRWLKNSTLAQNPVILKNLQGATCRRPSYLRGTPFADLSKEHLICK